MLNGALVDLLLIWSSSVISVVFKAELWHQPGFPVIVYISNIRSLCPIVLVHVSHAHMGLSVRPKRRRLSIFKGKLKGLIYPIITLKFITSKGRETHFFVYLNCTDECTKVMYELNLGHDHNRTLLQTVDSVSTSLLIYCQKKDELKVLCHICL